MDRLLDFGISDMDEILLPPSSHCACTYGLCPPMRLSPSTATHHSMVKLTLWNQDKAFTCHSASEHGHATICHDVAEHSGPPLWPSMDHVGRMEDAQTHTTINERRVNRTQTTDLHHNNEPPYHTITEIYY